MRARTIAHVGLIVAINVVLLELLSYAFLLLAANLRPHYFAHPLSYYNERLAAFSDEEIRTSLRNRDSLLSWDNSPNTQMTLTNVGGKPYTTTFDDLGARVNALFPNEVTISTYGDSHTLSDEVNDDETWQVALSGRLGTHVRNFGVGAYGTDQAVLKLERNLKRGLKTPYVILGVHEENLGRVVNVYRLFYYEVEGADLTFKPRFVVDGTQTRLLPAPNEFSTVEGAIEAVRIAAPNDYWYALSQAQMAKVRPLFSWHALDFLFIVIERRGYMSHPFKPPLTFCPSCWNSPSPWREAEPQETMGAIIDRFVALSREYEFQPILLFFPHTQEYVELPPDDERRRDFAPPYREFLDKLTDRYSNGQLTVIDMADRLFDPAQPVNFPAYQVAEYRGHTSAYGNGIISDFVFNRLKDAPSLSQREE